MGGGAERFTDPVNETNTSELIKSRQVVLSELSGKLLEYFLLFAASYWRKLDTDVTPCWRHQLSKNM